jgi:nitroreductase/NAD-dependent dihydropyrimidine dehydrogenase PreA subunit
MKIFSVDQKKCIKCNKCVKVCSPRLFKVENDTVINYADPYESCIKCGHSLSVCPSGAIHFESSSELTRMPEAIPDIHSTMNLLHSKRSLRNYSNKSIQKPAVEEILKAMTCAPSGTNAQSCDFIVITNNEIKKSLQDATVKTLKAIKALMSIHWLLKPFVSEKMYRIISSKHSRVGLDDMLKDINSGDDRIFFNAPVIIVGHIPASGDIALVDSTIAFTYGMLAGHALGIGSCWMGFTMVAVKKNKKIHKMLNIPKGRIIAGVITLGYPSIEYLNVPIRNERNVAWMD